MNLEEAILHAVEGNALLFLGAGFSSGAVNQANRSFPLGGHLCERLIADGDIDVSADDENDRKDLGYIAELYLECNTKRDLLKFLKKEFGCKEYSEAHAIIAETQWKRIYTTNYDDIVEMASKQQGVMRETIDPEKRSSDVLQYENAIVHMNGYIHNEHSYKLF